MESKQERIEEVTKTLTNNFPIFHFEISPPDFVEYNLLYYGTSGSNSFKNIFGRKVDDLILELKMDKLKNEIKNDYVNLLIDELKKTINSFELKNINGREFYFQTNASITLYDGYKQYLTIENMPEDLFDEVVRASQLKYDYTLRFIDGLKEILHSDKQNEKEERELSVDEYFDLLFDQNPHYEDDVDEVYDSFDNLVELRYCMKYKQFLYPDNYKSFLNTTGRKILHKLKIDHSNNKINDKYLESYLDELKIEKGNFFEASINGKEYLCHKEAYLTSEFINPLIEKKLDLNKLDDNMAVNFIAYNKYRYEVIQLMAKELESFLSKIEVKTDNIEKRDESEKKDDFGKLELNKSSMSEIALLFRLLEENKVFTAKYKTHIFRVIQNSFKGSDKLAFNEGSIKNAFNEPDPNSVINLEFLLANMKTSLKNI